ncbi:Septum formation protein Maf [Blautia hydrogenotrophica]|uniref:Maf family protein n=1 Tax=Blautia hydrogenotrophica TaxID=53443 RepID=UPI0006BEF92D|nr:Maf family protein [Blautia hydrogenotrophica]CUN03062.1 Septum formation protein Maf [Blautia hydrogenotrophica]SCH98091.1 Septum formation protein Maf [uncultured Blautia sp.]
MRQIILASSSPRRRELLEKAGVHFQVMPSQEEEHIENKEPAQIVENLSWQKAASVASKTGQDVIVIGSDTLVAYEGRVLGKPRDAEEAVETLKLLQGNTHQVYTGVTVIVRDKEEEITKTFSRRTDVTFYPVDEKEIRDYVATGDPMDKAGSYDIRGDFSVYIKEIYGDYNNVVGLPVSMLFWEMKQLGINLRGEK